MLPPGSDPLKTGKPRKPFWPWEVREARARYEGDLAVHLGELMEYIGNHAQVEGGCAVAREFGVIRDRDGTAQGLVMEFADPMTAATFLKHWVNAMDVVNSDVTVVRQEKISGRAPWLEDEGAKGRSMLHFTAAGSILQGKGLTKFASAMGFGALGRAGRGQSEDHGIKQALQDGVDYGVLNFAVRSFLHGRGRSYVEYKAKSTLFNRLVSPLLGGVSFGKFLPLFNTAKEALQDVFGEGESYLTLCPLPGMRIIDTLRDGDAVFVVDGKEAGTGLDGAYLHRPMLAALDSGGVSVAFSIAALKERWEGEEPSLAQLCKEFERLAHAVRNERAKLPREVSVWDVAAHFEKQAFIKKPDKRTTDFGWKATQLDFDALEEELNRRAASRAPQEPEQEPLSRLERFRRFIGGEPERSRG